MFAPWKALESPPKSINYAFHHPDFIQGSLPISQTLPNFRILKNIVLKTVLTSALRTLTMIQWSIKETAVYDWIERKSQLPLYWILKLLVYSVESTETSTELILFSRRLDLLLPKYFYLTFFISTAARASTLHMIRSIPANKKVAKEPDTWMAKCSWEFHVFTDWQLCSKDVLFLILGATLRVRFLRPLLAEKIKEAYQAVKYILKTIDFRFLYVYGTSARYISTPKLDTSFRRYTIQQSSGSGA